jgi:hypothetical protein
MFQIEEQLVEKVNLERRLEYVNAKQVHSIP